MSKEELSPVLGYALRAWIVESRSSAQQIEDW